MENLWPKSFEGLRQRYRPISREAVERLRYELSIIEEKGFSPYFLIVDEIAAQARAWGLRTIGRGSAANSLVSHCLALTHVDPLARIFHASSTASADIVQSQGVFSIPDLDVLQHTFVRSSSQTP